MGTRTRTRSGASKNTHEDPTTFVYSVHAAAATRSSFVPRAATGSPPRQHGPSTPGRRRAFVIELMKNVTLSVDKNVLVIRVDLTKDLGLSSTGKTRIIATTAGNAEVPGHEHVELGLNVFKKA